MKRLLILATLLILTACTAATESPTAAATVTPSSTAPIIPNILEDVGVLKGKCHVIFETREAISFRSSLTYLAPNQDVYVILPVKKEIIRFNLNGEVLQTREINTIGDLPLTIAAPDTERIFVGTPHEIVVFGSDDSTKVIPPPLSASFTSCSTNIMEQTFQASSDGSLLACVVDETSSTINVVQYLPTGEWRDFYRGSGNSPIGIDWLTMIAGWDNHVYMQFLDGSIAKFDEDGLRLDTVKIKREDSKIGAGMLVGVDSDQFMYFYWDPYLSKANADGELVWIQELPEYLMFGPSFIDEQGNYYYSSEYDENSSTQLFKCEE